MRSIDGGTQCVELCVYHFFGSSRLIDCQATEGQHIQKLLVALLSAVPLCEHVIGMEELMTILFSRWSIFVAGRAKVVRVDCGDVMLLKVFDFLELAKQRPMRENFRLYYCLQEINILGNFSATIVAMSRPLSQLTYAISFCCRGLCIYGRSRGQKETVVQGNRALAPMLSQAELLS